MGDAPGHPDAPRPGTPLTPQQAAHAKAVFLAVAPLGLAQREEAIDRSCADDAAVKALVLELLRGDAAPLPYESLAEDIRAAAGATAGRPGDQGEALSAQPHRGDAPTLEATQAEMRGDYIGKYRLLERIGEGGFGVVFAAEQTAPVRRIIALKVIKLGMDTRQVVARFAQEQQALAIMDHPGIAKVFDAGATITGRPYFVMELVRGEPITEYCDRKRLGIRERLALMVQVCDALLHAHQKGIIHRDLKPSNILVSTLNDKPVARIIDFGVAKATTARLTEKTIFTEMRQMIGTPEYMSPEQAGESSDDVDTRTDVYSAGVLLYELLTGATPFDPKRLRTAAYAEIQRIIREEEPPRPSTRVEARSETTTLAADRRATHPARLSDTIRGEIDWIVMKAMEKDRTRRYESASALAADLQRYLQGDAVLAAPPSSLYQARKFVRRNRVLVTAASAVALSLLAGIIAFAWQARIATRASAHATQRAEELQKVAEFQSRMLRQVSPSRAGQVLSADVIRRHAAALAKAGVVGHDQESRLASFAAEWRAVNPTDAAFTLIESTILRPAVDAIDAQFKDQPLVDARLRETLADVYQDFGLYEAAHPLRKRVLELRRKEQGDEHPDTLRSLSSMGGMMLALLKPADAEPYIRDAIAAQRRTLGDDHPDTLKSISGLVFALGELGKLTEAEAVCRDAHERSRRALGEDHEQTMSLAADLGMILMYLSRPRDAEPLFRKVHAHQLRVHGPDATSTAQAGGYIGEVLMRQGRMDEAFGYFKAELEVYRRSLGDQSQGAHHALYCMSQILSATGKLDQAEALQMQLLEDRRRAQGAAHPLTLMALVDVGATRVARKNFTAAIELLTPHEAAMRSTHQSNYTMTLSMYFATLARAHTASGRFSIAEPYFLEARSIAATTNGESHANTIQLTREIVALYESWNAAEPAQGHDTKAAPWREKLSRAADPQKP